LGGGGGWEVEEGEEVKEVEEWIAEEVVASGE
jgi:hypothetical protein